MTDPTPARILEAALHAFDSDGFAAVTTAQICRRAAVSNGSLFHHFGSKDGIAASLYLGGIRAYQDAIRDALRAAPGARAGVRAVVAAHQVWAEAEPALARFLFERGRSAWSDAQAAAIQAENARFLADLRHWAAPHVAAGRLRDLPVEVIAAQLIGPIQIFTRAWLAGRSPAPPGRGTDSPVRALQAAAWRGLRGPLQTEEKPDERDDCDGDGDRP